MKALKQDKVVVGMDVVIVIIQGLLCILALIAFVVGGVSLLVDGEDSFVYKFIAKHTKLGYNKEQEDDVLIGYYNWRAKKIKKVKEFPTISFKQFKDFYYLNPNSWVLENCRVYKNGDNNLSFTFTYSDYKKYKKFKKQIENDEKNRVANKKMQDILMYQDEITRQILEEVQKDIDRIRKESEKEIDEATKLIKGVKL